MGLTAFHDLQEKFDLRILSDDERIKEIDSFIVKKQTENALDCARWIKDKKIKKEQIERINIYKKLDETKDYISALESFVKVNNWKEVKSIAIIIGENDIIQLADYKINGKRIEEKTCLNIIFKAKSKLLVKEAKTIVDEQSEFIKDVSKEIIKELKEK